MQKYQESEVQDKKRQRREWFIIFFLILVFGTLWYIGSKHFALERYFSGSNSTVIFALEILYVTIFLALLYLTVRNLVKLLFERKKNIMGARLRYKLVLAFIFLSIGPTAILFAFSAKIISTSIERWYKIPIERSLQNSVALGQDYKKKIEEEISYFGWQISSYITGKGLTITSASTDNELRKYINEKRDQYNFARIHVYSQKLVRRVYRENTRSDRPDLSPFNGPGLDEFRQCFNRAKPIFYPESEEHGDLISGIIPVFSQTGSGKVVNLVVIDEFIPIQIANKLKSVSMGLDEYRQSRDLMSPFKTLYMIYLSIVSLLIIFISVWLGFYLSKGITVPIQELAEGTERIASGDYDFFIDLEAADEIGVLVNSFNRMTLDLKNSKKQLEEANDELIKSNIEIEQRRLYMEIVLANVGAGVISADMDGTLLTVNKSAEEILGIGAPSIVGKNYREVMGPEQVKIINDFLSDKNLRRKGYMQNQIRITTPDNRSLTLLISLNMLKDDQGKYSGLVAVFDDLSEIEKAQREAAWRQVARRIAHEVKNPLTPIQLSAQRIKKRIGHKLETKDAGMLNECTCMIIKEAEVLKRLVNEFSSYARMPASNPAPDDLSKIIREAVVLYQETQNNVKVTYSDSAGVPVFRFDGEQIKRVMINLLDNAVKAVGASGEVRVSLVYDKELDIAKIEVADNGRGIPAKYKKRVFEPYFSTKSHGTGLGLAIVSQIIKDHRGFIEVYDNSPKGTRFVIELPISV
ncbi:MAG: ATP-binding protein [Desulfobacteraceae bacterium]|jgi:two-component system nitrogen regulation sensor histidine kinase NtrY